MCAPLAPHYFAIANSSDISEMIFTQRKCREKSPPPPPHPLYLCNYPLFNVVSRCDQMSNQKFGTANFALN